jgi:hypothetical protein
MFGEARFAARQHLAPSPGLFRRAAAGGMSGTPGALHTPIR